MLVPRQHVIEMLRVSGLQELAEEARRTLPDPVEFDRADRFLAHQVTTGQPAPGGPRCSGDWRNPLPAPAGGSPILRRGSVPAENWR